MQDHPELSCLCQVDAGGHCISKVSRVRWYGEELSHWTSIDTEYEQGYPFDHWYFGVVCNWNTTYPILIDLFIGIRENSCCRPPTCSFSLFFGFGFKDNRKQAKTPKLTFGVFSKILYSFFLHLSYCLCLNTLDSNHVGLFPVCYTHPAYPFLHA